MITFDTPLPWEQALDMLDAKGLLPTHLSSREIREQWGADLRARSLFSARMTKAEPLHRLRAVLADFLNGTTNLATARYEMQQEYAALGYDPEAGGFPGAEVEPADRGSLRDLSSEPRIDLQLRTNLAQVAGAAETERANSPLSLHLFPAWELTRVAPRFTPRGKKRTKDGALVDDVSEKDWPSRWEQCGGNFYDGHMIATKDDPIWDKIGSSGNFDDALDTSFPPFAFGSGFGRVEISRRECLLLGVINDNDSISPATVKVNEGLKAAAADMTPAELRAISAGLKTELAENGKALKLIGYDYATGAYIK